jgi:hypothetical protein
VTFEESELEETAHEKKETNKKRKSQDKLPNAVAPKVQKTHPARKSARTKANAEPKVSSF